MLEQTTVHAIEQAAAEYPSRRGAAIDALKIVQRRHGWVSDAHLAETAALLHMSAAELEGIATFYNQIFRRPVGRHVIQSCDGVVCWMLEQERVVAELVRLGIPLGGTSADDRFTLVPTPCLGACHRPAALWIDGELHEGVRAESVAELLARYP